MALLRLVSGGGEPPPPGKHHLSRAEVALARARRAEEARRRVDRLLLWRQAP